MAMNAQRSQENGLSGLKPSRMNRLQRSVVSKHVSAIAKDSTVRTSNFLARTLHILSQYFEKNTQVHEHWKVKMRAPLTDMFQLTSIAGQKEALKCADEILVGHLPSCHLTSIRRSNFPSSSCHWFSNSCSSAGQGQMSPCNRL